LSKKNYNFQEKLNKKKTAKAFKSNANVSLKYATEIVNRIKGKPVKKVERFLQGIIEKTEYLPLRKYNKKVAHRKGTAKSKTKSGRYPKKTAKIFLELINSVKANADYKGLGEENLLVKHCFASKGFSRQGHQPKGKISGKPRAKKSAHIEIIVQEGK